MVVIAAQDTAPAPLTDAQIAEADDGREWYYPQWVITPENQRRWRICTLYAEAVADEDAEGYADTVHFMSRSLYRGDLPTE